MRTCQDLNQLLDFLNQFGFTNIEQQDSEITFEKDDSNKEHIYLIEKISKLTKGDEVVQIIEVFFEEQLPEKRISIYLDCQTGAATNRELFEWRDFYKFFKKEIRDLKIKKIIG